MPRPGLRSKKQKRKEVRTPGNENVKHYWRRKPSKAVCMICKKPLSIPRARPSKMKNIPLSKRRVNRLESGRYCANCLQKLIKEAVRQS
ncbi:MAG: 50S ribosomal protein L34e [Candidatus Lokiarchaeota archaeon]|nr:50S ribosomal protein L34e [Candidatus Lokiarchaeota archaeon]